jgi:hypothetical protein
VFLSEASINKKIPNILGWSVASLFAFFWLYLPIPQFHLRFDGFDLYGTGTTFILTLVTLFMVAKWKEKDLIKWIGLEILSGIFFSFILISLQLYTHLNLILIVNDGSVLGISLVNPLIFFMLFSILLRNPTEKLSQLFVKTFSGVGISILITDIFMGNLILGVGNGILGGNGLKDGLNSVLPSVIVLIFVTYYVNRKLRGQYDV